MQYISFTLSVLNFSIPSIFFNLLQCWNIHDILFKFGVLKFDKSKFSILVQNWNIASIFITLSVLNFSIPNNNCNLPQPENIYDIFVTFEVLKLDKSKYSNSEHNLNIASISITLSVLNVSIPIISFIL